MKNKFIAYDKRNKRFIPSYRVAVNGEGEIYISQGRGEGYYLKVGNRIEILEYSGKTDCNGVDLYRGDILKVTLPLYDDRDEDLMPKTITGVVVIRPSEGARILVKKVIPKEDKGITTGRTLRINQERDIRIGHVYTNSELLK